MSTQKEPAVLKKFLTHIAGDLMNTVSCDSKVLADKIDVQYNTVKRIKRYDYDVNNERLITVIARLGKSTLVELESVGGFYSKRCLVEKHINDVKLHMRTVIITEMENRSVRWELQNYISPLSLRRMRSDKYLKIRIDYYLQLWTALNFNVTIKTAGESCNLTLETPDPITKLRLGMYRVISAAVKDGTLRKHVLMETFDHLKLGRYWLFSTDDLLRMVHHIQPVTTININTGVIQ